MDGIPEFVRFWIRKGEWKKGILIFRTLNVHCNAFKSAIDNNL